SQLDLKSKLRGHAEQLKKEADLDEARKQRALLDRKKELAAANFLECRARVMHLNRVASQLEHEKWKKRASICSPSDLVTYEV
ncbi:hypothetical protein HDU91_004080, partial [Kappamyces sp. JEL0680]